MAIDAYSCDGQMTFEDLENTPREKPKEVEQPEPIKKKFEWSDQTFRCSGCEHAKFKEQGKIGAIYFCNIKHSYITEITGSWLCRNEHYQRRGPKA